MKARNHTYHRYLKDHFRRLTTQLLDIENDLEFGMVWTQNRPFSSVEFDTFLSTLSTLQLEEYIHNLSATPRSKYQEEQENDAGPPPSQILFESFIQAQKKANSID